LVALRALKADETLLIQSRWWRVSRNPRRCAAQLIANSNLVPEMGDLGTFR
jgi:urocanate hydratase